MYIAIGMVEFNSIAKGIEACDAMVKVAKVDLIEAHPVCAGKYIVYITGNVDAVRISVNRGLDVGDRNVVDKFIIPNVHPQVQPALTASSQVVKLKALGCIETFSAASVILAADAAVKAAKVDLIEIRLANGMGGKSFVTLTGDVGAVQSAIRAGVAMVENEGFLVESVVIPSPHDYMGKAIL